MASIASVAATLTSNLVPACLLNFSSARCESEFQYPLSVPAKQPSRFNSVCNWRSSSPGAGAVRAGDFVGGASGGMLATTVGAGVCVGAVTAGNLVCGAWGGTLAATVGAGVCRVRLRLVIWFVAPGRVLATTVRSASVWERLRLAIWLVAPRAERWRRRLAPAPVEELRLAIWFVALQEECWRQRSAPASVEERLRLAIWSVAPRAERWRRRLAPAPVEELRLAIWFVALQEECWRQLPRAPVQGRASRWRRRFDRSEGLQRSNPRFGVLAQRAVRVLRGELLQRCGVGCLFQPFQAA